MYDDIQALDLQLDAIDHELAGLVSGIDEPLGMWSPSAGSWSIAQCLDHLGTTNRVYLAVMAPAADRARAKGRRRRGPAMPGWFGRWFASQLEPPVKPGGKWNAPANSRPRSQPSLAEATASFAESQRQVRSFLRANADLDLAGVLFANPFIRGIRLSLATGLCNILAHDRRHLWQAAQVRIAASQIANPS